MTAPAIIATTASSQFSGTFAGTNATDRNFVSYWVASTSTGWLRVQLASPYAATGYRLMSNFEPNRAPRSWTFEGSNDGTTWDVLDTRTDVPNWASPGELRAYTFSNSTAYEYYRVNVTANKGDAYLALAEFWMDAPPQDSGSDPFPAEVVADSPTIWIRGSETSGALADDSSGNAIPALLAGTYARNAASLLTAGSDPAIGFTAARGSIPSAPVASTAAITLEAVIHSTSVGAYQIIWLRDDENVGNRCWQFRVTPTGALEFIWWNNSNAGPYTAVSSAGVIVEDTTHHVAATYDGSNARLYVDGAQVAVTAQAGTLRATNITTRTIRIAGTSTSGFPLIGRGDEFLLYDGVALSAARIAAHAAAVTAEAGPPSGAGSGSFSWAGSAAGSADYRGVGSGSFSWAGAGSGVTPLLVPTGSGTGAFAWAGAAAGSTDKSGVSSGAFDWSGSAEGTNGTAPIGSGSGSFSWSSEAIGPPFANPDTRPVRVRVAPRLHTVPVPAPIPASLASNVKPVVRYSHVAPALSAANAPLTEGVDYAFAAPVVVGYERFFVDGIDRTYWRDTPVIISRLSSSTPLGYSAASIEIPAMHPWEEPGVGECEWMRPDAPVVVALVDEDDEIIEHLWSGFISKDSADLGQGRKANGITCDGMLWQAGYAQHEPPHYMPPTDIGTVIPDLLNSVPGKRYADIPRVVTGIMTRTRGSSAQKIGQIVNEILQKEGWTVDGRQWTIDEVAPDEYRMVLKAPASTVHATVTYGAKGIEVNLDRDQASRIDLIYGVGNAPNGGQWRGTRFPGLVLAQPPEYPNDDASSMHLGDTDADTDSGTGISDMQRRLVEMGYSLTVDGVLNANDIDVIRRLQGRMGLLVDGVPGPQTWSGIFNRGPEGIDLTQWREPLAALNWTQEYFRDPNGIILSDNPAYANTAKVQHPVEIHYGENITWTQAQPLAEKLLAVESTPALTGQIVCVTDPHEMSRRHLKAGMNIKVVGFQGRDVVLRIARVDLEADGRVILAVDERGRDALTVEQIRARDLAAMADPVRRPGNPNRESRISRDRYVVWDIDSPCGFMPRTAVYGGLWVAPNPIPFAEVGRVVKTMLTCTVPFTLALMALPTKPSQMHSIVGDPHTQTNPWEGEARVAALDALGWIISWGSQGERCGFSPNGQESSGAAFTGKFEELGGFDFISGRPPYVWPLLFASETGFIGGSEAGGWGRFYPDTSV